MRVTYQMWGAMMRGGDLRTDSLFSYVSCEARVPPDHPLRPIRADAWFACRSNSCCSEAVGALPIALGWRIMPLDGREARRRRDGERGAA
jgi:hypothetical protein